MGLDFEETKELFERFVNTKPENAVSGADQSMFWWTETVAVPANSSNTGIMFTVPKGRRIIVLGFDVSSRTATDSQFDLIANTNSLFRTLLDTNAGAQQRSDGTFPKGSIVVGSEADFKRKIWNYDVGSAHSFIVNILAMTVNNN